MVMHYVYVVRLNVHGELDVGMCDVEMIKEVI
jgi:hypothetical protein